MKGIIHGIQTMQANLQDNKDMEMDDNTIIQTIFLQKICRLNNSAQVKKIGTSDHKSLKMTIENIPNTKNIVTHVFNKQYANRLAEE